MKNLENRYLGLFYVIYWNLGRKIKEETRKGVRPSSSQREGKIWSVEEKKSN